MNLAERGRYFGSWQPNAVAIRTHDADVSWAELAVRVSRVASGLADRGVEVGDRVGILGHNSVHWCVLALAAMHRGAIVVPLNIRLAAPELTTIIDHAQCRVVAYDSAFQDLASTSLGDSTARLRVSLDGMASADVTVATLEQSEAMPVIELTDSAPAVIGYTSGTTGLPKGVILTHGNLAACALQTALAEGSTTHRRTLLCIPLAFTGGIVNNFLSTYVVGGTVVLEPTFEPERVVEVLESQRITTWFAVPIMWEALLGTTRFAVADLSPLTTAICGGATVPRQLLEAYQAKGVVIRQAYGLTEATGSVCLASPAMAFDFPKSAGQANVHTQLTVLDEDGNPLEAGEVGEIAVRGPQVMAGYWRDEHATAEAIRDGWLLSGDLGRLTDDGLLEVVDRKKNMFISGGLNVYPAEIERVIDALPEIAESAAFSLAHDRFGEACAVVVRGVDGPVDEEMLLVHCRAHLADYKVPRTVLQTRRPLPRGMSGKLLRKEIRDAAVVSA